jgi:hypothetical protein
MTQPLTEMQSDILLRSHRIAELMGEDEIDVEAVEEVIRDRDRLIRDYFAAPISADSAQTTADLIRSVLDLDAESCRIMRTFQQRIGQELAFIRRSHKAADAYSLTEQD